MPVSVHQCSTSDLALAADGFCVRVQTSVAMLGIITGSKLPVVSQAVVERSVGTTSMAELEPKMLFITRLAPLKQG